MKNYFSLLKTMLMLQWRRRNRIKGDKLFIVSIVSLSIVYVIIMISTLFSLAFSAPTFKEIGGIPELSFFIMIIGMTIVVIFGTVAMLSFVYFNRDAEFLASLPVRSGTVFLVKMTLVYFYEFVATLAIMFLPLLTVGISAGEGFLFYLGIIIASIIVPAIPLLLAALLSIPLMYIVSFFKSKAALSTIVLILVFGAVMFAYYFFMGQIQQSSIDATESEVDLAVMLTDMVLRIRAMSKFIYPLYLLSSFMTLTPVFGLTPALDAFVSLLLAVGILATLIAITYFISNLVYARSVIAQLESKKNSGAIKGSYEQGTAQTAIMKKDFKYLLRIPSFGFQCFSTIVLTPLMLAGMNIYFGSLSTISVEGEASAFMDSFTSIMVYFMLFVFAGSMNIAAASALSREGEGFRILKTLPLTPKQIVQAKLKLSLILAYTSAGLGITVCAIIGGFRNALDTIYLAVLLLLFVYFMAHFAFTFDLKEPRLDWTSPNDAVKRNKSANVSVLLGMLFSMAILIPYMVVKILLSAFFAPTDSFYLMNMFFIFLALLAVLGVAIYFIRKHLYTNLERYWYNINI